MTWTPLVLSRKFLSSMVLKWGRRQDPRRNFNVSAFTRAEEPQNRTQRAQRVISTLNPSQLDASNFVDISAFVLPTVTFQRLAESTCPQLHISYRYKRDGETMKPLSFPDRTRGFLYYYSPAHLPFAAGEVRFRIVDNGEPSNFARGKDLYNHRGVPWKISLLTIASDSRPSCRPLREQLLMENLVTKEQLAACARIANSCSLCSKSTILHSLDQPFPIKFGSVVSLWSVAQEETRFTRLDALLVDSRKKAPYAGSALARFEHSTLPEHANTRTVVMRIIKITEPLSCTIPDYNGFVSKPTQGGLVLHGRKSKVWSCRLGHDTSISRVLTLLADGCAAYGAGV